jgi:hypothetical protein
MGLSTMAHTTRCFSRVRGFVAGVSPKKGGGAPADFAVGDGAGAIPYAGTSNLRETGYAA